MKELRYVDITEDMINEKRDNPLEPRYVCEYIKEYRDGNIIKYDKSNAKFDKFGLNYDEMKTVKKIQKYFKWNIELVRKINIPEGIRCPDIRNLSSKEIEYWDIKGIYKSESPNSKSKKISRALDEAKGQTSNVIIDLNRNKCDLSNDEALEQLIKTLNRKKYFWVKKIILFGKDNLVKFYKQK